MDYSRLIKTLKITNPIAYRTFCDLVYGFHVVELPTVKANNLITVELPVSDLFKKIYGPVKVTFTDSIKTYNVVGIEPKEYLEECHKSLPISYKGIMIPNTGKDKFKIDLMLKMKG